jgi:uncharacterized SAM-binding protein YcdF (DUF218 family)
MSFIFVKALSAILLPPLNLLLLALLGLLLVCFRRRTGIALIAAALAGMFLLSMPVVATTLAELLEIRLADGAGTLDEAQAIVILGAGSYPAAPEYGGDTVGADTLERVRWGARLHRLTGLPILVSGGNPFGTSSTEAAQMQAALSQDFRTDVKWTEERSYDTFASAHFTRALLAGARIDRIALVTHALHMMRARLVFEQAGFRVIEAPTGFSTLHPPGILNYLPSAHALELSSEVLRELIGSGWYHLRIAAGGQQGQR